jgi:hypothetical protein
MRLQVVEVVHPFSVNTYTVQPGARVMAWRRADGAWIVSFNGNDVPVAGETVCALGTAPDQNKGAQAYSAARLEQYQLAPVKPE